MFNDFKPVLKILLRFIILYVVMVFAYQFFLNGCAGKGLDPFSTWTMKQVNFVQNSIGYESQMVEGKPEEETTWFYVNGEYVSRMVEGCNAVSIMVLFLSFVFAFYEGVKTFIFAAAGLVILHLMNVMRIAGLNVVIAEYPQYAKIGHDYFFPAIIYGTVVLLWLVWIRFFALKKQPNESA